MEEGLPTYLQELFIFSKDSLEKFCTFHINALKHKSDNVYSYVASRFRIMEIKPQI
jgi:hypothetical protein